MEGVLNVLKPPGMTSHDVVNFLRRKSAVRKVGHTGTLDPLAAGVLVLCFGRATRIAQFIQEDKAYRAEVTFGIATTTGDALGAVAGNAALDGLDLAQLESVLAAFTGPGTQIPPMTSAVKVGGRKLYELARQGVEVPREPRPVEIYSLRLVGVRFKDTAHPRAIIDVECSKGTYIRTLCADIGARMGCGAYMSFLVRTAVGGFSVGTARTLEEIGQLAQAGTLAGALLSIDAALSHLPVVWVRPGAAPSISSGRLLYPPGIAGAPDESAECVRLKDDLGLLAVARPADPLLPLVQNTFKSVWVRGNTVP